MKKNKVTQIQQRVYFNNVLFVSLLVFTYFAFSSRLGLSQENQITEDTINIIKYNIEKQQLIFPNTTINIKHGNIRFSPNKKKVILIEISRGEGKKILHIYSVDGTEKQFYKGPFFGEAKVSNDGRFVTYGSSPFDPDRRAYGFRMYSSDGDSIYGTGNIYYDNRVGVFSNDENYFLTMGSTFPGLISDTREIRFELYDSNFVKIAEYVFDSWPEYTTYQMPNITNKQILFRRKIKSGDSFYKETLIFDMSLKLVERREGWK